MTQKYNCSPRKKLEEQPCTQEKSVEQLTADPDADAGTHNGNEDLTHDAGSAQTDQAEHDAAYKTAQNAQHDIAHGGSFAAHNAAGDVTSQSADQQTENKTKHNILPPEF